MSQVKPEDVKDFLNAQPSNTEDADVGIPPHETIDLDELKKEQDAQIKKTKDLHESVEDQRNKIFEPDKASLAHLSSWVFQDGNFKVEVTDLDKSMYVKALLNDVNLELPVKLEMGIEFLIRSLTNFEFEVIFSTLNIYSKEERITGPAQYASLVQQCAAAIQIIKMGGNSLSPPNFEAGSIKVDEAAKILKDRVDNVLGKWAWPKWQAAITALRIFEIKLATCNENARQANFWQTADVN
jgi:hypothetical protein